MKAAVLHGKEDVRIEEVPERSLDDGEVRVKIGAALTCGTDLKVFKRGYHAKMIVPPAVFGHELAGEIVETASGAGEWSVGERVVVLNSAPCSQCDSCGRDQQGLCDDLLFLNGAYAGSVVVPARIASKNMLRLRPETPFVAAALCEPLACVVLGATESGLARGQKVLVIGSGPIGLMFVRLASFLGCDVTLIGRGESRLNAGRKLGASNVHEAASASASALGPDPFAMLLQEWKGRFDVVIEAVGKPEAWEAAVRFVRKGGRVNFFGGCPSGTMVRLDTGLIHYSNLTLNASFHHTPATTRRALELIEQGVVRSQDFVDGACDLDELPELFKSMASGNRAIKTLVNVGE